MLVVRPETMRLYLRVRLQLDPGRGVDRRRRADLARPRSARSHRDVAHRRCSSLLLLGAATANTYASFNPFPNALFPEATPYVLPLAAVFLVWLHVTRAVAAGTARWPPSARSGSPLLALASAGLMIKDARQETATVHGPHGSLAARPAEAPALQQALDAIARNTRPGEPVLLAPQMTALYVMADRPNPLPQLSLLPGALATPRMRTRRSHGCETSASWSRTARPSMPYEHGPFGTTYDRRIAAWLRSDFRLLTNVRDARRGARTLDIWLRKTP